MTPQGEWRGRGESPGGGYAHDRAEGFETAVEGGVEGGTVDSGGVVHVTGVNPEEGVADQEMSRRQGLGHSMADDLSGISKIA